MDVDDRTLGAVVLRIDGFVLVEAREVEGEVWLRAETMATRTGCRGCGVAAVPHARRETVVRDVPLGGRPARLVWNQRIWRCGELLCATRTWTERARAEICRQVGKLGWSVAELAREYGVGWQAAMSAVRDYGALLVDDPARLAGVEAMGVDETAWLRATRDHHTLYVSGMVDLGRSRLLDVVEGRTAKGGRGLARRPRPELPRRRRRGRA